MALPAPDAAATETPITLSFHSAGSETLLSTEQRDVGRHMPMPTTHFGHHRFSKSINTGGVVYDSGRAGGGCQLS